MQDDIIEPIGIPEFFTDGFSNYTLNNGILRCVGYSMVRGQKLGVIRLVMAGEGAMIAADETREIMNRATTTPMRVMRQGHH